MPVVKLTPPSNDLCNETPRVLGNNDVVAPADAVIAPEGALTTSNVNVVAVGVDVTIHAPFGGLEDAAVVPIT